MSVFPQTSNNRSGQETRGWQDESGQPLGQKFEVILIIGEPISGELSALFELGLGIDPSHRQGTRRGRRLLIFVSDIRDRIPIQSLQTPNVDIHVLSKQLSESDVHQASAEAIYLLGALEKASQFASAWRADAERFIREGRLSKEGPFSFRDNALSFSNVPRTNAARHTRASLNNDVRPKLHRHRYTESNPNPIPGSKGLLPKFRNLGPAPTPQSSSPSTYQARHMIRSSGHYLLPETYGTPFDAILNFLPPRVSEKSLLKQVILVTTLCRQYLAPTQPHPSRAFGSPTSRGHGRAIERRVRYSEPFPKEKSTASTVIESGVAARRTSTDSSSISASVRPSTSAPTSPILSGSRQRWSVLSWLSTTSASQASDSEPGANEVDTSVSHRVADANERKSSELRRRLSNLFGRAPSESILNRKRLSGTNGEESERRPIKNVQQTSPEHGYLIHILPTSWIPASLPSRAPKSTYADALYTQKTQDPILVEPGLLQKRRNSSPLPLRVLNGSVHSGSRHSRMQMAVQMRMRKVERRRSMPVVCAERNTFPTILDPVSEKDQTTKPRLADNIEKFLGDYFGQEKRGVLSFVLDAGVLGREVRITSNGAETRRMLLGEAVLCGLLDKVAMKGQCWIGNEDLVDLVVAEGCVREELKKSRLMGPKQPLPAVFSPELLSSGSSAERSRSRATSDYHALASKCSVAASLSGVAMGALKTPEPVHVYPPLASSQHHLNPSDGSPTAQKMFV